MKFFTLKNCLIAVFLALFTFNPVFCIEDKNKSEGKKSAQTFYDEIITLDENLDGDSSTASARDDDDFILDDKFRLGAQKLFAKQKKLVFKDSFLNEISGEIRYRGNLNFENALNDTDTTYPFDINGVIDAKFHKNQYRFFGDYAFARDVDDLDNKFFGKFSALYLERKINDKHLIRIGTSRAPIGLEGSISSFALPLAKRAQIARNFGNATATGISFIGSDKFYEYNIAANTSTRNTQGFDDGAEVAARVGFRPFFKKESPLQNLRIYGGANVGHRGEDYGVYSSAISYEYKKFLMNFEYAYANGSNSKFYVGEKQQGFFTTVGWNFTPKLQLLGRFDQFDPNNSSTNDIKREYTVGLNYVVYKQRPRFMLNYVFSQDEKTDINKNAIYFVTQVYI